MEQTQSNEYLEFFDKNKELLAQIFEHGVDTIEFGYCKPSCITFMFFNGVPAIYCFFPNMNYPNRFRYIFDYYSNDKTFKEGLWTVHKEEGQNGINTDSKENK